MNTTQSVAGAANITCTPRLDVLTLTIHDTHDPAHIHARAHTQATLLSQMRKAAESSKVQAAEQAAEAQQSVATLTTQVSELQGALQVTNKGMSIIYGG